MVRTSAREFVAPATVWLLLFELLQNRKLTILRSVLKFNTLVQPSGTFKKVFNIPNFQKGHRGLWEFKTTLGRFNTLIESSGTF